MISSSRAGWWAFQLATVLAISTAIVQGDTWLGGSTGQQGYPNQPIKLVVPFNAGGGTDKFARIIKKGIEDNGLLPQPLVIINQGGAGATIGSRRVKDAEPDGYTTLILHDAILTAKYSGTVDYGPEAFQPIAGTGEVGMVIAVLEDSEFKSLDDLMSQVYQRPDEVTFGANLGALTHFAGLQLERLYNQRQAEPMQADESSGAAFRFAQIGGGADRFADLKGGHIDVTGFSIEEFLRFESEGLRGLAFFDGQRHPAAPDVPTAREQGYDVISTNTFYWWFPAETPRAHVDVIASALEQAMRTDYVREMMQAIHCRPIFVRGDELQQRLDVSAAILSRVVSRKVSPLPNVAALLTAAAAVFAVAIGVTSWQASGGMTEHRPSRESFTAGPNRYGLALICVLLTLVYVVLLTASVGDFRILTALFVFSAGSVLARSTAAGFPLIGLALILSFGLHYVFTELFVVDLFQ